ncbi:ABC transporter substrate-binding protein [Piscinibacter sp. XHJ-5]|uniref:ABC transporter substrate-binding protein n=1 Tax=Piscinibacter sp. XHJ-5 TaxID=3037797 RepID=UPI00245327A5|nr:ABC transporter substrate-binding protein [Piscinibacter sp. XHJ-5]
MLSRALTRLVLAASCLGAAAAHAADAPLPTPGGDKVLRYSFRIAETGFDPPQLSDLYSRTIVANMFDSLYEWEFLARPVRMRPRTAAGMPEASADFTTFTIRLRPGTYFADDPAFSGRRRELVAADYVYAIKRIYDPRWKSPHLSTVEEQKIVGLAELRQRALAGKPFDYDRDIEGVRALDRYTIQFKLGEPSPRFVEDILTDPTLVPGTAREVVEAYTDKIMEHPVGTGPFRLARWVRSSLVVLDKNPNYRDVHYHEEAPANDPLAQSAVARLEGRKLPLVDRVEVHIIEENQPRWLAFLRGDMDVMEQVPEDFTNVAIPNNRIAPNLAKQGLYAVRYPRADASLSYFGMENPVVGGYTPDKVALRRAIALAVDIDEEIRVARRGQAIPGQSPIGPNTYGYDPAFRSEMSEFSRAKAKALLDMHGYVDRDGDGWRDRPDGSPLVLEYNTQPDDFNRQLVTLWKKNMTAIGIRMTFNFAKWPENLKASRAGKLMMWGVGWSTDPDGSGFLVLGYGPQKGQGNHARFDLPEFNRLYEQQKRMPNSPERLAVMTEAKKLMIAYMPYKVHVHRIWTDLAQPWVVGYHRNVFIRDFWRYVDIDTAELARRQGK